MFLRVFFQKFKHGFKPNAEWGPNDFGDKLEWRLACHRTSLNQVGQSQDQWERAITQSGPIETVLRSGNLTFEPTNLIYRF